MERTSSARRILLPFTHCRPDRVLIFCRPTTYVSPTPENDVVGVWPMDLFTKLFGSLLALVYHCFDRIVILGHLPLLTRPENMVHFFRDVHGIRAITKEVLRTRTNDYNRWVESFARNHQIPIEWAEKGVRKEDYVRPALRRMERRNRCGVYFILKSMEVGTTFRSATPKYPTADPDYRILSRQRCRYTHYYFYIRDEVLGPLALCV